MSNATEREIRSPGDEEIEWLEDFLCLDESQYPSLEGDFAEARRIVEEAAQQNETKERSNE